VAEARHQRFEDRRDLVLELVVQHELALGEARDHLDGHVVGRRAEPTARDDQVDALVRHEAELRVDVLGPVAADRDVRQLDAELEQAVGQPWAVPVPNPPGQDLGPGHHNAGAGAHALRD
jgi:hypothetical protein